MKIQTIPDKYLHSGIHDVELITEVIREDQLSGTSTVITEYEDKLSKYFSIPYVVAQSSGSAALHSALHNLKLPKRSEVLIPSIAPLPTALPILTAGLIPKFVDVLPNTFTLDPSDLESKISKNTKAAVVVPIWGYPIDLTETVRILKHYKIPLIEDCAQAHGTLWKGKHFGSFGLIGCWSTHDRKMISTGEGGFIATKNKRLAEKIRQFSQLGYMDSITYGVNYKLSSLQAAIGISRIPDIESQIKIREKNVAFIQDSLKHTNLEFFPVIPNSRPNYYGLLLKLPFNKQKNRKFLEELAEKGVPSDLLKYNYVPLYKRKLFANFRKDTSVATERIISSITSLPVHPGLRQNQIEYMVDQILALLKQY